MIAEQFGRNSDAVTTWGCDFSVSPQFLLSEEDWRGGGGGQRGAEVEVCSRKEERKKKSQTQTCNSISEERRDD